MKKIIKQLDLYLDNLDLVRPLELYILYVNYQLYVELARLNFINVVEEHVGNSVCVYHKYKDRIHIKHLDCDIAENFEVVSKY